MSSLDAPRSSPTHFVVVLDRTQMTAPTREGREALVDLANALLPRLDDRCLAWADLYDARRFASLAASGEHDNGRAYPQPSPAARAST